MYGGIIFVNPVSIDSAASLVGVSSATIRNWVKAGHLTPANVKPLSFWEHDVIDLKAAIGSGSLDRLRKRANKSNSNTTLIPKEYVGHPHLISTVERIVNTFKAAHLDLDATMYFVALRVLELRGELLLINSANIHELSSFHSWRRNSIKKEITHWHSLLSRRTYTTDYNTIYFSFNNIDGIDGDDFLGIVYQSLNREGDKSNKGSYYTPSNVIDNSLCQQAFSGGSFLDPCCGTGNYLLRAVKLLHLSPTSIYGFDSDGLAVRIARLNFLLAFPSYDSTPNIECLNTLTELATGELLCQTNHLLSKIDFIATNPPWGAYKNSLIQAHKSCGITSNEAFSLFLSKSLTLLREGGVLSFILPESFLKIKTHSDIRSLILTDTKIVRILKLGRQFTGVFTPAIRLDLIKEKPTTKWVVEIKKNGNTFHVEQSRFTNNEHQSFDVDVTSNEVHIMNKIYEAKHITLSGNAEWALGIVTGNNEKYVSEHKKIGMEPVIRGSDISKFRLREPQSFIYFDPKSFQQVAKLSLYRASEKLIYKFISKSLAFAYDDKKKLTLNSANILIPHFPEHGIKIVLAFLNSTVFQYIFLKKYSTHKVLRGDLEKLPFPVLLPNTYKHIEMLVDYIIAGEDRTEELESIIFSSFNLSEDEIELIKLTVKEG